MNRKVAVAAQADRLHVDVAVDGVEAVEAFHDRPSTPCSWTARCPSMDGYEATIEIRASK